MGHGRQMKRRHTLSSLNTFDFKDRLICLASVATHLRPYSLASVRRYLTIALRIGSSTRFQGSACRINHVQAIWLNVMLLNLVAGVVVTNPSSGPTLAFSASRLSATESGTPMLLSSAALSRPGQPLSDRPIAVYPSR